MTRHEEALKKASDARLDLHMERLDDLALKYGYTPRIDLAEWNRVHEVRARRSAAAGGVARPDALV